MEPAVRSSRIGRTPMSSEEFRKKAGGSRQSKTRATSASREGRLRNAAALHSCDINDPNFYPQLRHPPGGDGEEWFRAQNHLFYVSTPRP